jgi:hypothetical protein
MQCAAGALAAATVAGGTRAVLLHRAKVWFTPARKRVLSVALASLMVVLASVRI